MVFLVIVYYIIYSEIWTPDIAWCVDLFEQQSPEFLNLEQMTVRLLMLLHNTSLHLLSPQLTTKYIHAPTNLRA